MHNKNVAIIILNWKGWEDTVECLESLYHIDYPNYDVIVVDNGSSDDSVNKIKEYCQGKIKLESSFFEYDPLNKPIKILEHIGEELKPKNDKVELIENLPSNKKIILIKNKENYGFAEGNNIGIKYALDALNPDYILLLNNDTVVDKKFLHELVNVAKSSDEIGAVGPKTYFYSEKDMIQWTAGGFINSKYFKVEPVGHLEIDNGQYDRNQELDFIIGSCVLCKREMIEKVGLLNLDYFMYFEDVDWSLRILKNNYKCVYAYKSKIWHKMGVSSSNCFKTYYFHMNRVYLFKKYYKRIEYLKSLLMFILVIFPQESLYLVRHTGIKHYLCYLKGIMKGITKKPPEHI
ncbi:MAG: glycosyltransferase family 2 protein [Methanobacterium sp.]|jgi:GT2 family glycosyltransferase